MQKKGWKYFGVGCGCSVLALGVLAVILFFVFPLAGQFVVEGPVGIATQFVSSDQASATPFVTPTQIQEPVATATIDAPIISDEPATGAEAQISSEYLNQLYETTSPGVVSIYVFDSNNPAGQGAGSGFLYDSSGHIVTNNHVVNNADLIMVVFHDGTQKEASVVGLDPDSDLAVIQVEQTPESAVPLPVGTLDSVDAGDWVVAIGNPFGLNSSMSIGIISAVGRTIPSGVTPFAIPHAIQTDAAINPGNSGGPLLNLQGQVIGVNAQIASSTQANAGVGFSIPADILRRVVPSLIEVGAHNWSWLGVTGTSVNLFIQEANDLPEGQRGAYLVDVIPDSPAEDADLQGTTETTSMQGIEVPVGGDVIVKANDTPIESYADLQLFVAQQEPGTTVTFSVVRAGELLEINVELAPRPE